MPYTPMISIIKTLIALGLSWLGLAACQDDGCCCPFFIHSSIYIGVSNAQGEDLLNPKHPNAFLDDEIKLFSVINGNRRKVFNSRLENSDGYELYYDQEGRRRIYLKMPSDTAIIQWSDVDFDTLVATIRIYECGARTDSIWINNELKLPFSDPNLQDLNLVKEGRKIPPTSQ